MDEYDKEFADMVTGQEKKSGFGQVAAGVAATILMLMVFIVLLGLFNQFLGWAFDWKVTF